MTQDIIDWLNAGDPAISWQTQRDLLDRPVSEWVATRSRVATEGWGRAFLAEQDLAGTWGDGLYQPKWTSTHYTLLLLRRLGLPPGNRAALAGCRRLLDDADWVDGGVSYWGKRKLAERCVNGMVLAIVSWFEVDDPRTDGMAAMLLDARMADGAWNCRDYQGAQHSSFHTTISVLEGLLEWKRLRKTNAADDAIASGQEFLLAHRLFRSHRTGEVINPRWLEPAFPPRWHYDVLRGLDHLRSAGTPVDSRAAEAIEVVSTARRADATWKVGRRYTGKKFFTLEPGREPSRWNTLRAIRVLRWWDAA